MYMHYRAGTLRIGLFNTLLQFQFISWGIYVAQTPDQMTEHRARTSRSQCIIARVRMISGCVPRIVRLNMIKEANRKGMITTMRRQSNEIYTSTDKKQTRTIADG
jgi:hypothetical protein